MRGFSLVELTVTNATVGILAAIALPDFSALLRRQRAIADANALLAALWHARSEAITRNQRVVLCKSRSRVRCDGEDADGWDRGVMMFADANHDGLPGAGETVLRAEVPLTPGSVITLSAASRSSSRSRTRNTEPVPPRPSRPSNS